MWLPKEEYFAKLKDPKWQKKRLEILQRDNFTCQICGDKKNTLHVHHRTYLQNRDLWEYADTFFVTLCESCHEMETQSMSCEIRDLNTILKLYYFADEIHTITGAILQFDEGYSEVRANIIKFALTEMKDEITKKYFKSLKKKGGKNGKA